MAEKNTRGFDLGMGPPSGLEDRSLGPLWNRLVAFLGANRFQLHQYLSNFCHCKTNIYRKYG
jgi:hypothetical protein